MAQIDRITLRLPFPPRDLNPNNKNGRHWGSTHAVKKSYERDCWASTLEVLGRDSFIPNGPVRATLIFQYPGNLWDIDNSVAAIKSGIDGVARALKINDAIIDPVTVYRQQGVAPGAVLLELQCQPSA